MSRSGSCARARCDECGDDFLIAYSCKGRGICPSCNTRRMVETAAHQVDHLCSHRYRYGSG
ncbi:MAG: transposase zinc-binding domain-containing protein [Sedimenticola sp.]